MGVISRDWWIDSKPGATLGLLQIAFVDNSDFVQDTSPLGSDLVLDQGTDQKPSRCLWLQHPAFHILSPAPAAPHVPAVLQNQAKSHFCMEEI